MKPREVVTDLHKARIFSFVNRHGLAGLSGGEEADSDNIGEYWSSLMKQRARERVNRWTLSKERERSSWDF